jgi:transcriptional regulator with XRE-family HTH domain
MNAKQLKALRNRIKFDMRSLAACLSLPLSTYQRYEDGSAAVPERVSQAARELEARDRRFMAGLPARVDSRLPAGRLVLSKVEEGREAIK